MNPVAEKLKEALVGRTCVVGVGNPLRGDDGVGVHVAQELAQCEQFRGDVIDAGDTPENEIYHLAASHYDVILFVDAARFGGNPGDVTILPADQLCSRVSGESTHRLPLTMAFAYLLQHSNARLYFLGIEPNKTDFGDPMTPAVLTTAHAVVNWLTK